MKASISGLDLCEAFFTQTVAPLLGAEFPQLRYSCGLIGPGSEVLGFDDGMSADHDWGPRALLFLSEADRGRMGILISEVLSRCLPREFLGYSTSFTENDNGTAHSIAKQTGWINHRIEMWTIPEFLKEYTGFNAAEEIQPQDWLTIPQQKLRTITGGRVFRDDLNLNEIRTQLSYYPRDVWLYQLAAGWTRIEREEHLMGRSGYVGDELGSAIIAARLVR